MKNAESSVSELLDLDIFLAGGACLQNPPFSVLLLLFLLFLLFSKKVICSLHFEKFAVVSYKTTRENFTSKTMS